MGAHDGEQSGHPPLHPSIVVEPGVELTTGNDGTTTLSPLIEDAIVGQLGMPFPNVPEIANISEFGSAALRSTLPDLAPQSGATFATLEAMTTAIKSRTEPSSFGALIAKLRRERGWDISELARKAGLNRSIVERVENGATQKPHAPTVKAFADVFDLTVAELEAGGKASDHGRNRSADHKG